jgi:hypothetical protein
MRAVRNPCPNAGDSWTQRSRRLFAGLPRDPDHAALAVLADLHGDPSNEPPRGLVADEDRRGEALDPDRMGAGGEALDERGPDPASLPFIRDGAREVRLRRILCPTHEAGTPTHRPLVGSSATIPSLVS